MVKKIEMPIHHPKTLHRKPYWLNNSLASMIWGKMMGYKFADQDMQCDAEGVFWGCHWGVPSQDGYTYLWTGKYDSKGHEVRIKDPNPKMKIAQRTTENVSRLRKYKSGRLPAWCYTKAVTHAIRCEQYGMTMCGEAKGSPGFDVPENWRKFEDSLHRAGVVNFFVMTLSDIGSPVKRGAAVHKGSKLKIALLPRGRKPADWDTRWRPNFDRLWGSWS